MFHFSKFLFYFSSTTLIFCCVFSYGRADDIMCPFSKNCTCQLVNNSMSTTNCRASVQLRDFTFNEYPELTSLKITASTISISDNAFSSFRKLTELSLTTGFSGLGTVPVNLPATLTALDLSQNSIRNIYKKDFKNLTNLVRLSLRSNYISNIEVGAFESLAKLREVSLDANYYMTAIDLSIFGFNQSNSSLVNLNLNQNMQLNKTTVSDFTKVLTRGTISLQSTNLSRIDPSVKQYLENTTDVRFDFTGTKILLCRNLVWLAPYTKCQPNRVVIEQCKCADQNDELLEDYFREIVPNYEYCQTEPSPQTTTKPRGAASKTFGSMATLFMALVLIGFR